MKDELGNKCCGMWILPSGITDCFHHCSIVLISYWLWVLIINPLDSFFTVSRRMLFPDQLFWVLAVCLWSSHSLSQGKRSSGDRDVVTKYFSDLCMLHGHVFILSYKDTRNLRTAWDLIRKAPSSFSLVTLCVLVTASTYRLFVFFCLLKRQQFNMWIREAHQWFLQSLLGNNSTSRWILWVLHEESSILKIINLKYNMYLCGYTFSYVK